MKVIFQKGSQNNGIVAKNISGGTFTFNREAKNSESNEGVFDKDHVTDL